MKNRTPLLVHSGFAVRRFSFVTLIAAFFIVGGYAFGKTASCPCSPCTCSPCTCGSGGKGDKHHGKEKEHGHAGVGVEVNVDLSGVGQRKAEPNPFATTNEPSVSHTQEKTTKKHTQESTAATFDKIDLTSEKAKDLEEPDEHAGTQTGGGTVQISDETGQPNGSPVPQTQEKKKEKPKWPKPVQRWLDKKKAARVARDHFYDVSNGYNKAFRNFEYQNKTFMDLWDKYADALAKVVKAEDAKQQPSQADKENYEKLRKQMVDLSKSLEKDFQQTDAGKAALKERDDAKTASDQADAAEKEAGKYIDPDVKAEALKAEAESESQGREAKAETKGGK